MNRLLRSVSVVLVLALGVGVFGDTARAQVGLAPGMVAVRAGASASSGSWLGLFGLEFFNGYASFDTAPDGWVAKSVTYADLCEIDGCPYPRVTDATGTTVYDYEFPVLCGESSQGCYIPTRDIAGCDLPEFCQYGDYWNSDTEYSEGATRLVPSFDWLADHGYAAFRDWSHLYPEDHPTDLLLDAALAMGGVRLLDAGTSVRNAGTVDLDGSGNVPGLGLCGSHTCLANTEWSIAMAIADVGSTSCPTAVSPACSIFNVRGTASGSVTVGASMFGVYQTGNNVDQIGRMCSLVSGSENGYTTGHRCTPLPSSGTWVAQPQPRDAGDVALGFATGPASFLVFTHHPATDSFSVYSNGLFVTTLTYDTGSRDLNALSTTDQWAVTIGSSGIIADATRQQRGLNNIYAPAFFASPLTLTQIGELGDALRSLDPTLFPEFDWPVFEPEPTDPAPAPAPSTTILPAPTPPTFPGPAPSSDPATGDDIRTLGDRVVGAISGLWSILTDGFQFVADTIWGGITWVVQTITLWLGWIGDLIIWAAEKLETAIEYMARQIVQGIGILADLLREVIGRLAAILDAVWGIGANIVAAVQGIGASIVASLGTVISTLLALPGLIVDGIRSVLIELFVPAPLYLDDLADECTVSFPCSWVTEGGETVGAIKAGLDTGMASSVCGPTVGFAHAFGSFAYHMPSPAGCPGNGPGGAYTADDARAFDVWGYRVIVRTIGSVLLWVGFAGFMVRQLPWSREDEVPGEGMAS